MAEEDKIAVYLLYTSFNKFSREIQHDNCDRALKFQEWVARTKQYQVLKFLPLDFDEVVQQNDKLTRSNLDFPEDIAANHASIAKKILLSAKSLQSSLQTDTVNIHKHIY